MKSKKLARVAIAAVIAAGVGAAYTTTTNAASPGMEKCYGVAKAGKNDCGSKAHACAGQASKDKGAGDWIYLPKGSCGKISGGSTSSG